MNDEIKEEKKKRKTKNTKKKINDKLDMTIFDKEIEQFIEDLRIHTKPAYTIRKIKPFLSDEWINNISK
jgi:hypothetical protein